MKENYNNKPIRVLASLNKGLHEAMSLDENVIIIGEDIVDPYGGAFKVTSGLSTIYPSRVIATPISEAGITGVAIGLALTGYKSVVELMFGDFLTLAIDQLINQASKYIGLNEKKIKIPMVLRTPMGGRRGYGPTHSQSIERLMFGIPHIKVVACSNVLDPGTMLKRSILETEYPVIFIENKVMYSEFVINDNKIRFKIHDDSIYSPVSINYGDSPDVTIVTYGGMVPLVIKAAQVLHEREDLNCEIIVQHQISPILPEKIIQSALKTKRVTVVEEGIVNFGWGAEVSALLSSLILEAPIQRVGSKPNIIPASRNLETSVLPQIDDIINAVILSIDGNFK